MMLLLLPVLWSCYDINKDPGQYVEIDPQGWSYGEEIRFKIPLDEKLTVINKALPDTDTSASHDSTSVKDTVPQIRHIPVKGSTPLAITICHSDAYPYANLWLQALYKSGDTIVADTFNIVIADEYGRWKGNGTGVDYQFSDTIATRYKINGGSELSLKHIMRVNAVPEIFKIGLTVLR